MYWPFRPIVVVEVSGRFLPRTIAWHVHVPRNMFIEEKSGVAYGTGVGAGEAAASVLTTPTKRPTSKALHAITIKTAFFTVDF
jgi:hypothetical protein